jgi:hypothetical protein
MLLKIFKLPLHYSFLNELNNIYLKNFLKTIILSLNNSKIICQITLLKTAKVSIYILKHTVYKF